MVPLPMTERPRPGSSVEAQVTTGENAKFLWPPSLTTAAALDFYQWQVQTPVGGASFASTWKSDWGEAL